jgi:UrcA family protein
MTVSRTLAAFAAIALCTAGLPALAHAAAQDAVEINVPTTDLNLNTADGVSTLHKRIHMAARTACTKANPAANEFSEGMRSCEEQAVSQAREAARSAVRVAEANQAVSLQASAIPR